MKREAIIRQFYNAEKDLVLLRKNEKKPIDNGWPSLRQTLQVALAHDGNLGWRIDEKSIVIDVDPRNGGDASFEKLKTDFNLNFTPDVLTPRGGFHIYLVLPSECEGKKFSKNLKGYEGIDFLRAGMQCVIPPSSTADGEYRFTDEAWVFNPETCPDALLKLLVRNNTLPVPPSDSLLGDFAGLISCHPSTLSREKMEELLYKCDPSVDYKGWIDTGMAVHNWDPIEGFELWNTWSQGCPEKYKEGECAKSWSSFDVDGGITLRTLIHKAQEADYHREMQLAQVYLERIINADKKTLEFDLSREIRKTTFSATNREQLVVAFQSRLKEITGTKVSIASIRAMLAPSRLKNGADGLAEVPDWCNDWVYVTSEGKFYNMQTLKPHSDKSFNVVCGHLVPATEGGYKLSATKFIADWGLVETADIVVYLPSMKDRFYYVGAQRALNIFNPHSLPRTAEVFTEEGQAAIALIQKHILHISGTPDRAHIFEQWLAHQVQSSGELLKWAPLIQSIQGTGKSFFTKLLRGVLGDNNVGVVMPSQVMKDFNGWAVGRIVNVLEELRMVGQNRHTAANALKPLITDEIIQINDKGISQFTTYNTANYICFTNFQDALPMEAHDRRWWVIFAPVSTMAEFAVLVGEPVEDYFEKLYYALENHASEVRKWLLEYPISPEFKRTTRAPMTEEKRIMIEMEEQNIVGLMEAKEAIAQGNTYFDELVVSSSHLFVELSMHYNVHGLQSRQKNQLLQKLGFQPIMKPIKIGKEALRMWVKKPMTNDEIRQYIQNKILEAKWEI